MIVEPTAAHRAFRDDMIALLRKHAASLPAREMLALVGHLAGQVIALQDQRTMTARQAMELLGKNVEIGNAKAVSGMLGTEGNA
jgi:hypothetical protein